MPTLTERETGDRTKRIHDRFDARRKGVREAFRQAGLDVLDARFGTDYCARYLRELDLAEDRMIVREKAHADAD